MSDDLIALKILVVSDSGPDRLALRDAAAKASVPIEISEVGCNAANACRIVTGTGFDAVLVDTAMSRDDKRALRNAAMAGSPSALFVSMGAAGPEPGRIASEGFVPDAVLVKPVSRDKASELFAACVRARLPSRVLVVDDSETVRAVVRKVLQSCRYRFAIEEAADGVAALAAADRQRFDLVLLDSHMPGRDSFDTLRILLRQHNDLRVVMLTATNDGRTADRARAAGAHDVLFKPFFGRDIDAVMNRLYGVVKAGPRG